MKLLVLMMVLVSGVVHASEEMTVCMEMRLSNQRWKETHRYWKGPCKEEYLYNSKGKKRKNIGIIEVKINQDALDLEMK